MRRRAVLRPTSKKRSGSRRLTVEQLEERLPPGEVISLSAAALWGLNFTGSGSDRQAAPIAITSGAEVGRALPTSNVFQVHSVLSIDVSVTTEARTAPPQQPSPTPAPRANRELPGPE